MKKLFFIIGLFFSLSAMAQPTNYTKINMRYRWLSGMFDSALYVPRYNGTPSGVRVNETSVYDGMIAMDTTNNRLYIYSGGSWIRLAAYSEIAAYTAGNGLTLSGSQFKLGGTLTENTTTTTTGYDFNLVGIPTTSSTTGKKVYLLDTVTGKSERIDPALLATTSLPISSLTAATGTNSINNGDYQQTWNWNSLSGYGFVVQSSATTASNGSRLFYVLRSGTNANAGVTSYSGYFSNSHIGTSSTNIAGLFSAQSGTNNYAIIVPSGGGSVGIGTTTPNASALLDVTSTSQGAVLPRMNTTQMNAISSPVAGLMVYNSDSASYVFYNGTAWLKMGSGSGGGGTPGGSTKQFQYNNAGAFAGSSMLTQETGQILITGNSSASTPPFKVDAHEDLTGEIVNVSQSGAKKFAFHSNGSIEMAKSSLPSTPEAGYLRLTVNSDNSKLYTTNDAGVSAMLVQDLQLKFGAGSGADADTAAFTTTALYGDYFNTDTIKVTSVRVVMQGTSPSVTVKIFYNDSLGVQAGATALVTAGNAVTNTTTGTNITSFDVSTIPPNVYVWAVTSTVGTKPKYLSIQLNGYRK